MVKDFYPETEGCVDISDKRDLAAMVQIYIVLLQD